MSYAFHIKVVPTNFLFFISVFSSCERMREREMAGNGGQLSVRHWTPKHVGRWLREEGFCDYVDLLCNKHRLDGTSLLTLSEYDLRSPPLELKVLGDIKRLMVSLRKLQKQNADVLEELGLSYDGHSPQNSAGAVSASLYNHIYRSIYIRKDDFEGFYYTNN